MDWIKDKKNQPFVIGGALVLIIAAVAFGLYSAGVFDHSNPAPATATATAPPPGPPPGPPPSVASAPAVAAVPKRRPGLVRRPKMVAKSEVPTPGAAKPAVPAVVDPTKPVNPAAVHDPFSFGSTSDKTSIISVAKRLAALFPQSPVRSLLPSHDIYSGASAVKQANLVANVPANGYLPTLPAPTVALPRVAGVLYDRGVYAILQPAYGQAQSVKPGDTVSGVGTVTSIQSDGVTIKTTAGTTVQLPVSAGPPPGTPTYPSYPSYPGNPASPGSPIVPVSPQFPPGFTPPPGWIPGDPLPGPAPD